jgi:hypothetical protein
MDSPRFLHRVHGWANWPTTRSADRLRDYSAMKLQARGNYNKAASVLANKLARVCSTLHDHETYTARPLVDVPSDVHQCVRRR